MQSCQEIRYLEKRLFGFTRVGANAKLRLISASFLFLLKRNERERQDNAKSAWILSIVRKMIIKVTNEANN